MIVGLSALRLFSFPEQWSAMCDFYEKTLGLPALSADDDAGVAILSVYGVPLVIERMSRDDAESAGLVGKSAAFTFQVENAVEAASKLRAQGTKIVGGPEQQPWGGTLLFVADPAGNIITLVEHPADD